MPKSTECLISVELANVLRGVVEAMNLPFIEGERNFLCPECKQSVIPHRASQTTAAHFEHVKRNPDCSLGNG
jgi:hypothetical protein